MKPLVLAWLVAGGWHYGIDYSVHPPAVVWARDPEGTAHLDVPELLRAVGLPDTEENRDLACEAALEVTHRQWPGVPTHVEQHPEVRGN